MWYSSIHTNVTSYYIQLAKEWNRPLSHVVENNTTVHPSPSQKAATDVTPRLTHWPRSVRNEARG